MRISFHAVGTRGDVQPYMALAAGLQARGHQVQLVIPAQYVPMVEASGIAAVPLSADFLALMETPEGKAAIAGGKGFGAGLKLVKYARPLMRQLLDEDWKASLAFAPDAFVYHPKSIGIPHIAEKLCKPTLFAPPLPGFTPTAAYPTPLLPFRSLGPLNRLSHALAIHGGQALFGKLVAQWRGETLGLPGKGRGRAPARTIYGYSPSIFPPPPDWSNDVAVTGYWFLDSPDWRPDADLSAFLSAGPAPIYIGFGSMPGVNPLEFTQRLLQAVELTGKRALLAVGGGAIGATSLPPQVYQLASAPHDRLLPLVTSAVHHGGAGTTAAALRAGLPMTIVPFFGDQPFWGRLIAERGLGPEPIDRKVLTPEALAAAIREMDDPAMRDRAREMGDRIAQEDGVATACDAIEAVAGSGTA